MDDISDQIAAYMEKHAISKAELARRMGTFRAFITKILGGGDANITMKTFTHLLHCLGAKPVTRIVPRNQEVRWFDKIAGSRQSTVGVSEMKQAAWRITINRSQKVKAA